MLGFGDQISESIAHFVGYFHTSIEAARARIEYREFKAAPEGGPHLNGILTVETSPDQHFDPAPYQPSLHYTPTPWSPAGEVMMPWVSVDPIEVDPHAVRLPHHHMHLHSSGSGFNMASEPGPYFGEGPSETSIVVKQTSHLQDNDVVIMGTKVPVNLDFADDAAFAHLTANAFSISEAFTTGHVPGVGDMAQFFANETANIHAAADGPLAPTPGVTVIAAPTLDGLYVNGGVETTTAPVFDDYIPTLLKPGEAVNSPGTITTTEPTVTNSEDIVGSVTVHAGGNLMVNEVVLNSVNSVGAHFAVAGNYYHIDAIVQTNAYSDADTFENGFAGMQSLSPPSTNAMNIASFAHHLDSAQPANASGEAPVFPQNWQITVVAGDLIQMNWISQYNFMSDNDTHVLTSSGVYTSIVTGGNMQVNSVSFADLCKSYDLVMIGGHLYDGNFIFQTNILYDNDKFTTGGGAGEYNGALSSSDNLLWNSASIESGDTTNWVTGLPSHYLEAMNGLANGHYNMPDGFHGDQILEGIEGLRVLYISGNVYDLNYVQQVNVLGDADYVAHYEEAVTGSSDTVWDISTGSNALINAATIVDNDFHGGSSYVGGGVYSDAILIQAELVDSHPAPAPGQGQPLANEVVAFLDNDADAPTTDGHGSALHVPDTSHSVDVMQTVLA
ncbi:hypothetical protein J2X72_002175 [Phyllobacterium sp. 1468]|uniref:hypothetical protein n=1 Tax=Phyllobacterium sp. 1468 TaxID=2817759 RepID=UPI002863890C|nr:hypothetical protein [Phyllobacterium sp. 1468]MDR6633382.1 hypothetical protein [Phyllobacterium sp. 1468]